MQAMQTRIAPVRPIEQNGIMLALRTAGAEHVVPVVKLINEEHARSGSVLKVSETEVKGWVGRGLSFIAMNGQRVVGHLAVDIWPESKWGEIRSCVVAPDFRNNNINYSLMTKAIETSIAAFPEIVAFTALKNRASNGVGIFKGLGFAVIEEIHAPKELFSIGIGQEWTILKLHPSDYKGAFSEAVRP